MRTAVLVLDYPCRGILGVADVIFYVIAFVYQTPEYAWYSLRRFFHTLQNDSSKLIETFVALFCLLPSPWFFSEATAANRRWDILLAAVMPLHIYGIVLAFAGVTISIGLHFDLLYLRRIGQAMAFLVWMYLFIFFVVEFPHFLVVPLLPPVFLMALRSYWYLGQATTNGPRRTSNDAHS